MSEEPCKLVLSLHQAVMDFSGTLGELCSDVSHIKKTVDNGLSAKLASVEKALDKYIYDDGLRSIKLDSDRWFDRLLEGSVKKVIGLGLMVIILNGLTGASLWMAAKTYFYKENPGQQQEILASISSQYHTHILSDGRILHHANDPKLPAWIQNKVDGGWIKAPNMRVDGGK